MEYEDKSMIDEQLGAYLDDELDLTQRSVLTQQLTTEQSAVDRLTLLSHVDSQLRRLLAAEPVAANDRLAARLKSSVPMRGGASTRNSWARAGALAAACILGAVLGAGLSSYALLFGPSPLAPVVIDALDRAASGETRSYMGGEIALAQTIRTNSGYCRQARIITRGGASDILACREGESWIVTASVTPVSVDRREFELAGSQASLFDIVLSQRGEPTYVESGEERELIAKHWRVRSER
jgi:hypothetical protein